MARYQGGCLCGAVRYRAEVVPINERVCHCGLCQKAIGAAFNARVLFRIVDVTVDGPVATVNSSPDLKRGFCATCGTTMFSRRDSAGIIGITTGSLDDPSLFRPEMHMWTASSPRCGSMTACRNMKARRHPLDLLPSLHKNLIQSHEIAGKASLAGHHCLPIYRLRAGSRGGDRWKTESTRWTSS
ncbi:conserved hypothetical protein [Mesorhizobium sp. STM 4661]|nr:conserved hypothetical protein [Mesorhizobium sp. STM 4661]